MTNTLKINRKVHCNIKEKITNKFPEASCYIRAKYYVKKNDIIFVGPIKRRVLGKFKHNNFQIIFLSNPLK